LRPELECRLKHLEDCLGRLPEDQRLLVEGYYYHRTGIMKTKLSLLACASILSSQLCVAQTTEPAHDWKPCPSNQAGKQYPQYNSEGRVKFRIVAPEAKSVGCTFRESSEFKKGTPPKTETATPTRSTNAGATNAEGRRGRGFGGPIELKQTTSRPSRIRRRFRQIARWHRARQTRTR